MVYPLILGICTFPVICHLYFPSYLAQLLPLLHCTPPVIKYSTLPIILGLVLPILPGTCTLYTPSYLALVLPGVLPVEVLDDELVLPGPHQLGGLQIHPEPRHLEDQFPQVSLRS